MLNGIRRKRCEKMGKICFIEPPYDPIMKELDPPFPLMYLSAIAEENGWEAEILHMHTLSDSIPEADIYGVTSSSPQWPDTIKLGERLEKEFPEKLKILGGSHISAEENDFYRSRFDAAVIREGEKALKKILSKPSSAGGLIYGEPVKDLDSIPFPARHLVDWSRYHRGIFWGKQLLESAVSIISSRGCPFHCVFCSSHCVFGRHVRFRTTTNVVQEIKHVISEMGYRGFNFHDDTFCLVRRRVLELCREFGKLNIVWRCLTRADTLDEKLLLAMCSAGCKELILGMESGSQKILNNLQKGTTVAQNRNAMFLVKKSTIQLKVGVIVGSPGETWETVEATKKLLCECPPDFWNVSVFTPLPGSFAWKYPEKLNIRILTRNLGEYRLVGKNYRGNVVVETDKMNKEDIEHARDEMIDLLLDISPQ